MKKSLTSLIICLLLLLMNVYAFSQADKDIPSSIVHFVRNNSPFTSNCMMDIVFPNQKAFSISNASIVNFRIFSEGTVDITLECLCASSGGVAQSTRQITLDIKRGNEYYVLVAYTTFKQVEKNEVDKMLNKCKNVLRQEENLDSPILPSSMGNISTKKGKSQGTCFLISTDGYLVTNFHCIEKATEINIKGISGDFSTKYEVTIVASDPSNDLALLKLINKSLKFDSLPFALRSSGVAQAEKIYALGYPIANAMGNEMKITEGIISAKSGIQGDMSKFQISAAVNPGSSGGPLIDEQGNLIGVIFAKLSEADAAGYAIKGSYLETFLKNVENFAMPTLNNSIKEKSMTEKVAAWKRVIFILDAN